MIVMLLGAHCAPEQLQVPCIRDFTEASPQPHNPTARQPDSPTVQLPELGFGQAVWHLYAISKVAAILELVKNDPETLTEQQL